MEKRLYSSQGKFLKSFCTSWSLEGSPKQLMIRQKSCSLCWSSVRSLLHPSAADGERRTGQIAPVWHSWICCLFLALTDIHSANSSMATTLNQLLYQQLSTDLTALLSSGARCQCQSVLKARGGMRGRGRRADAHASRTEWPRVSASREQPGQPLRHLRS